MGILLVLVPIALFVAVALWVRRSRPGAAEPGAPAVRTASRAGRISLLTEAIVYMGAILVIAGGAVAIGQRWDGFSDAARLAILAGTSLIFLAIGLFARSSSEPALGRLTSVTWGMSVCAFAGTIGVVNQIYGTADETAFLTIATGATAFAVSLWALHRTAIQHALMFAGVLVSAASIVTFAVHDPEPWMIATVLWGIGVAWAALGWTRRIAPWWMAVPLGVLVALIAPANLNVDAATYALGICTAGTVMALGVAARFAPGLAIGAVAMLGYVVGAITHYFSDTIGVPAALAITGFVILILAGVSTRLFRWMQQRPATTDDGAAAEEATRSGAPGGRAAA